MDYPLQIDFIAETKGSNFHSLLVHSMTYGLGISLVFKLTGVYDNWKVFILIISHIIIDHIKANAKDKEKSLTTYLYIDQILHIGINIILYLL